MGIMRVNARIYDGECPFLITKMDWNDESGGYDIQFAAFEMEVTSVPLATSSGDDICLTNAVPVVLLSFPNDNDPSVILPSTATFGEYFYH